MSPRRKPPKPIIKGQICEIPLTRGLRALVDLHDLSCISQKIWSARFKRKTPYTQSATTIDGKKSIIDMGRFILKLKHGDGRCVDHINGNPLDNRRVNLRICSQRENRINRPKPIFKNPSSRFKGVWLDKRKNLKRRWMAGLKLNNKRIWIGRFETEIEAAKAYDKNAKRFFRKFAHLNFGGPNVH